MQTEEKTIKVFEIAVRGYIREEYNHTYTIKADSEKEAREKALEEFEEQYWDDQEDVEIRKCTYIKTITLPIPRCKKTLEMDLKCSQ